jgi:hypothetical protein
LKIHKKDHHSRRGAVPYDWSRRGLLDYLKRTISKDTAPSLLIEFPSLMWGDAHIHGAIFFVKVHILFK